MFLVEKSKLSKIAIFLSNKLHLFWYAEKFYSFSYAYSIFTFYLYNKIFYFYLCWDKINIEFVKKYIINKLNQFRYILSLHSWFKNI